MLSIKEMKDKTVKFVKEHKLETAGLIVGSIIVGVVATKSKTKVAEVVEALPVPDTTPEITWDGFVGDSIPEITWDGFVGDSRYWFVEKASNLTMEDVIEDLTNERYLKEW